MIERIFHSFVSFPLLFFFSPSSCFTKQIVTDIVPCIRHSLAEVNSTMNETHNLPSEFSCLEECQACQEKSTVRGCKPCAAEEKGASHSSGSHVKTFHKSLNSCFKVGFFFFFLTEGLLKYCPSSHTNSFCN